MQRFGKYESECRDWVLGYHTYRKNVHSLKQFIQLRSFILLCWNLPSQANKCWVYEQDIMMSVYDVSTPSKTDKILGKILSKILLL